MAESASSRFADHALGTRFADLPPAAVERAKAFVLDSLGVGIAGPEMGTKGILLLDTMNLGRARRHIAHEKIPTGKLPGEGILVTDPDGNQVIIVGR